MSHINVFQWLNAKQWFCRVICSQLAAKTCLSLLICAIFVNKDYIYIWCLFPNLHVKIVCCLIDWEIIASPENMDWQQEGGAEEEQQSPLRDFSFKMVLRLIYSMKDLPKMSWRTYVEPISVGIYVVKSILCWANKTSCNAVVKPARSSRQIYLKLHTTIV